MGIAFSRILANALTLSRAALASRLADPRRDIDDECGYPRMADAVPLSLYHQLYEREAVAARVVQLWPRESWQVQPAVYEAEDLEVQTPFERDWEAINKGLAGGGSYRHSAGGPIWEWVRRADEVSGIGRFGALLLGLDDGRPLSEPAEPRKGRRLLFLRAFAEGDASVSRHDQDPNSRRFGLPVEYTLSLATGDGETRDVKAHHSRIIHVADNLDRSEVYGVPRMRPVLNRLLDLRKLYAGSAEMFWKGALPGLSFETHPALGGDVEIDRDSLRDEVEQYMNGLQRYLTLQGMAAKSLAPQVADPQAHVDCQLDAICVQLGVPKRKLMGSERGELASTQDDDNWNDRLVARDHGYLTPRLVVPLVDRLVGLGCLSEPADGYSVDWPDRRKQSEAEAADVAVKKSDALAKYVTAKGWVVVPELPFLTGILGMPEQEAMAALDERDPEAVNAAKRLEPAPVAEGGFDA